MTEQTYCPPISDLVPYELGPISSRLRGNIKKLEDAMKTTSSDDPVEVLHSASLLPVTVHVAQGGYLVVNGVHRVTAMKRLGFTEVPATIEGGAN